MAHHHRKVFLINPKFQIRFSLIMCSIIFFSSLFYPVIIFEVIVKVIDQSKLVSADTILELTQYKRALILVLILFQVGFTALTFLICILISHKIAGPLYKISMFLTGIKNNNNRGKLVFRKHDYFQELADDYNGVIDYFKSRYREDFKYLRNVNKFLAKISNDLPDDKKKALAEITYNLDQMQKRYEEHL